MLLNGEATPMRLGCMIDKTQVIKPDYPKATVQLWAKTDPIVVDWRDFRANLLTSDQKKKI
jgi:hypothetical protein